jgi:hypothetical protein
MPNNLPPFNKGIMIFRLKLKTGDDLAQAFSAILASVTSLNLYGNELVRGTVC